MSRTKNATAVEVFEEASQQSMVMPVSLFVLSILYLMLPIDIIPDVPLVGHIDDFFITATATLNLLQKWLQNQSSILASMLGFFKWLVIFTGIVAVSLVGIVVMGIAKVFIG